MGAIVLQVFILMKPNVINISCATMDIDGQISHVQTDFFSIQTFLSVIGHKMLNVVLVMKTTTEAIITLEVITVLMAVMVMMVHAKMASMPTHLIVHHIINVLMVFNSQINIVLMVFFSIPIILSATGLKMSAVEVMTMVTTT